jgi:RNA polymerase sigma-70 factor (ECF subfamily)
MDSKTLAEFNESPQMDEEHALVHRCRQGDRDAFAQLMQKHERRIYNYTYRMLGNEVEAEDLTQDIFVAAFRGIKKFRAEAKFSTWLYRIALNQTRNRIKYLARRNFFARRTRSEDPDRQPPMDSTEGLPDTAPSPEQWAMTKDLAAQVQDCLDELPHKTKQLLILRDVQGLSYEELGQLLSLNQGTVKSRLHRARNTLQKILAEKLG